MPNQAWDHSLRGLISTPIDIYPHLLDSSLPFLCTVYEGVGGGAKPEEVGSFTFCGCFPTEACNYFLFSVVQ